MSPNAAKRDTIGGTLLVALVLCVACSVLVSSAAVGLRSRQEANKKLDQQRNVLQAAGVEVDKMSSKEIVEMFNDESQVKRVLIDLSTGEPVDNSEVEIDVASYDPKKAAKDPELSEPVAGEGGPTPGVSRREQYAFVYQILNDGQIEQYVLPVYGKGLWSTLYGFLAVQADLQTVSGITFYEHKETPGLGGEVDNPGWKAKWAEKKLFDEDWNVEFEVIKGEVDPKSANAEHQIDGLSGATITSRGVSNLVQYWVGPDGFGKYLENQRSQ